MTVKSTYSVYEVKAVCMKSSTKETEADDGQRDSL